MKRLSFVFLLFVLTTSTYAQEHTRMMPQTLMPALAEQDDDRRKLDVTHILVNAPEGQAALQAFHKAKKEGTLPENAQKGGVSHSIGATQDFNVIVEFFTNQRWEPQTFELKDESAVARIWVEVGELANGNISEDEVTLLSDALLRQTPAGSFNPNQGITANNNEVYGNPPNFDGDNVLDVLLYDVTEGNDDCCILGFFSPTDINPSAPAGEGNQADIIYLDSKEGSSSPLELLVTAAHEYQHLIHANYHPGELSFVNEGLSEWSEAMNGYEARANVYLADPANHATSLLTFRSDDPIAVTSLDYQRAGLFTNYIAEQTSVLTAGSITRQEASGAEGYEAVLTAAGTDLGTMVANFHVANYVNDPAVDARFGYLREQYQGVRATASTQYDGRSLSQTPQTDVTIEAGAVQYLVWTDVDDFMITLDARSVPQLIEFQRARTRPHIVLEAGGIVTVQELPASDQPRTFTGSFDRVGIVVPHIQPGSASALPIRYEASWTSPGSGSEGSSVATASYDTGNYDTNAFFSLSGNSNGAMATRFERPAGAFVTLDNVQVAPLYFSQFSGTDQPATAPRNFRLVIWSASPAGEPDQELFSLEVDDTRNPGAGAATIDFLTVDLSAHGSELTNLPDVFFVGLTETGSDSNFMVVGPSPYSVENVSFVGDLAAGSWQPLWEVQFVSSAEDEFPVRDRVIPIRATFLISSTDPNAVSNEDALGLPTQITLDANYPNPFNPITTIRYELPQAAPVTLEVFDVLGQRVAKIVEATQSSGAHTATVDASGWASGVYVYALTVGSERLMRTMTLLK